MPSVGTWSGSVVITGIIPMGDGGFFWKSTKRYILYCSRVVPAASLLWTFWATQLENPTARIRFHKHPSCEFQKPWKKSIGSEQKTPLHQHTIQYIGNNWNDSSPQMGYFLSLLKRNFWLVGGGCVWTNTIGNTSVQIQYSWNSSLELGSNHQRDQISRALTIKTEVESLEKDHGDRCLLNPVLHKVPVNLISV